MYAVNLYTTKKGEINRFLEEYKKEGASLPLEHNLKWSYQYKNPTEIADIIGNYIDNNDKYQFTMWISLDFGLQLKVTDQNADAIIRYLFERFPY